MSPSIAAEKERARLTMRNLRLGQGGTYGNGRSTLFVSRENVTLGGLETIAISCVSQKDRRAYDWGGENEGDGQCNAHSA